MSSSVQQLVPQWKERRLNKNWIGSDWFPSSKVPRFQAVWIEYPLGHRVFHLVGHLQPRMAKTVWDEVCWYQAFSPIFQEKTNGSQNLTRMYDLTYLQVSQQYCNPEAPHAASYEFLVSYTKGSTGSALPCSQEPQKLPRRCQVERGNINIAIVLHLIGVSLHIANKDQSWPNNLPQLPQRASGGSKGCHPFDTLCERSRS